MIEQGLAMLVQARLAALTPTVVVPCAFAQLEKDQITPATPMGWTYRFVLAEPDIVFEGTGEFVAATVRIVCHGLAGKDAITLGNAVVRALQAGFQGALGDPDATVVDSIIRQPGFIDGYSDANRTFVREIEYLVNYYTT